MLSFSALLWIGAAVLPSTMQGPAPGAGSVAGHCLTFDGLDDVVAVTRTPLLEPAEITVEMWARLDGPQDWNSRLLRKGEHDAYFLTADQDLDQHMQLLVTRGTTIALSAEDVVPHTVYTGTWHHFAGVYGLDHAEFWVDGVRVSQVTHDLGALTHLPLTDLYIGAGLPVPLQNEYFAGSIDEVRIWNVARSAAEIQATWFRTLTGSEAGLVAYWRFDEGSGQVAHDATANGHDGRLGGTLAPEPSDPTWALSDAPIGAGTAAGYCLAFDGVEDLVFVPRSASLEPEWITVELWARLDGPQDWNTRLLRKAGHFGNGYTLSADRDLDQRMQLIVSKDGTILQASDTQPHTAYAGAWHHFAGVYGADHAEFWVDGQLTSHLDHALGALDHQPLTDLYVGAGLPSPAQSEYFAGRIDEVRVWSVARSAAQIQTHWNRSLTGSEPALVAYWRFDEGAGQDVRDASPKGNDGWLGATVLEEGSDPTWVVSDAPLGSAGCLAANYCESSLNSSGQAAQIGYTGSLSVAQNDLHLVVTGAPPGHKGLFFYGSDPFHAPFGNGTLCISPYSPGLFRLPPAAVVDATGTVDRWVDLTSLPALGQITGGTTWRFQFWFRDAEGGGALTNLSDALAATFCP